ncbi:SPOR domain-containing protein [Parablastomonas sp. CN1-191]|uniref:SPOR domain-containing protein n=1 Tax=Parablastomonas sp. CN1-191 TaxID=3400908 RepID=UPI003BF83E7E
MAASWDDPHGAPLDTGQLELDGGEARLPWLESTDDEDFDDSPGALRLVVFAAIGALIVAVIAGAAWWLLRGRHPAALPEGSVIRAPTAPYKVRPTDPGGRDMAGTGDTSYAVSAGQVRPARLATEAEAPPPASAAPTLTTSASASASPSASNTPVATGPGVQVGAYSSAAAAEAGWTRLVAQHDILAGHAHRVVRASADIGTVWRLQAVTADAAAAQTLCSALKGAGVSCQVK